jgi:hypothetical protein
VIAPLTAFASARIARGKPLPSSLVRRRKDVSAHSFVQDSGARDPDFTLQRAERESHIP